MTPVHFYQPIPDTQSLPDALWNTRSELVGIDMNDAFQLDLLRNHFPKFRNEYEQFSTRPTGELGHFYAKKGPFRGIDAIVAHCMVRYYQPRLIIEIGAGVSSLILGEAAMKNNNRAPHLYRTVSSEGSNTRVSRVAFYYREKSPGRRS